MNSQRRTLMTASFAAAGGMLLTSMGKYSVAAGAPAILVANRSTRNRLEATLARIQDPRGEGERTFIRTYAAEARAAADAADARLDAGHRLSKLDGRIVSIKDVFDVAGEPTTAGTVVYKNALPAVQDAAVVQRLRAAGAVIIGKTNMTEFAFSVLGVNPHYGTPRNPFDRNRVPGGSSAGAAVAVADNFCEISIGTDSGGSIRVPSSFCGLVGFKPTQSRVSREGVIPLSLTTDTIGPLARSVQDAVDTDSVLSAAPRDAIVPRNVAGMRLAIPRGRLLEGLDPAVSTAYGQALDRLNKAHATLADVSLQQVYQHLDAITEIGSFSAVEAAWFHRKVLLERPSDIDRRVVKRISATSALSGAQYVEMLEQRRLAMQVIDMLLSKHDAIVLPTVPILPPKIGDLDDDDVFSKTNYLVLRNTIPFSTLDTPGFSLPLPKIGNLPIGLMLIGRRGGDQALFEIAAGIEALLNA